MATENSPATRRLTREFEKLQNNPGEGFTVKLFDENLFVWEIAIFGPPKTLYEGGYFKGVMIFPKNYPFHPPLIRFSTKIFHPNIYTNGTVCMSILNPPVNVPNCKAPSIFWTPAQTASSLLLSLISLLGDPNVDSPANLSAAHKYSEYLEGKNNSYAKIIRRHVEASRADAHRDGVVVPMTDQEYCENTNNAPDESSDDSSNNDEAAAEVQECTTTSTNNLQE